MALDIGLAVELVLGAGAQYGSAATYADLTRTWTDARTIPTQQALQAAYDTFTAAQTQTASDHAALRAQALTLLATIVGKPANTLILADLRILVLALAFAAGALDKNGVVKPTAQWLAP